MDYAEFEANKPKGEIEEIEDEADKRFKEFKNFEIISNPPPDHHYIKSKISSKQFDVKSTLVTRINEEWKILKAGLSNSIFIRAYDMRIDLMRAVIIGPNGTSYAHGLFFFDIRFPKNYPAQPPKLFFHSHGLDLNPNFNRNGKVSLSLLKTSYGGKEEKWNPKQSTILQVLEAIHGSILNSKPFIKEPCHTFIQIESLQHNNDVFMHTCQLMLDIVRMPPRHFEEFVIGYFREQAHPILMKCRTLLDINEPMNQLFLDLIKAFEENGAYCKHHLSYVKVKDEGPEQKRDNNGYGMKIGSKLRNLLDSKATSSFMN